MAKLQRKTQKIFAGNTTSDQITAFGTAKTTSPVYTSDVNAIQTDTFSGGWTPSLMSDLAPYLQDSNALHYVETYQLAYLMQQGIPEWDANTEYTQGSIVSNYNNGNLELYMSLQNLNINHQISQTSYWKKYSFDDLSSLITVNTNSINTVKSDVTALTNRIYPKTTYVSGANGYIIWSNGFAILWGKGVKESDGRYSSVTYLRTFANNNYVLINDCIRAGMTNDGSSWIYSKSATGCRLCGPSGSDRFFIAIGQLASGQY